MRLRGILLYVIPMTLLAFGLISRSVMPKMWLVECLFGGYRLYLTVIAATVLTVFGELYRVKRRTWQRPRKEDSEAIQGWTPRDSYGKGWWVVWGLLLLGFIFLSLLER
jgi:hypothetical protein